MQPKKLNIILILLLLLPVVFYVLPANQHDLVPAVKNHLNIIYPLLNIIFIILYALILIAYWKSPVIKKSQKWIATVGAIIILLFHYCVFLVMEVGNISLGSSEIVLTKSLHNKKVYIREKHVLFSRKMNSEIAYTTPFSLYYNVFYTTPNNINLVKAQPGKLVFEEYEYVTDSIQPKGFFKRFQTHIQVDSIIQVTEKDLK